MEPSEGDHFKYIPMRFYQSGSLGMTQSLIKPVSDNGKVLTLGELMKLVFPLLDKCKLILSNDY